MTSKELPVDHLEALKRIKLPPGWATVRLEVEFERKGHMGEWASVIYDDMNGVFYAKTNKSIIYEGDAKATAEAIEVMKKANKIICKK